MRASMLVLALLFGIGAVTLDGCGRAPSAAIASGSYSILDARDQPLRAAFNRDTGHLRLMFLVDPICPGCLRGLADMGDDLLSTLPRDARLNVYVVYEPVIGGTAKDIPAAAALLRTSLAHNYWNPTGDFGRQMSHVLNYWNGSRWVYAWDSWLIYPPDVKWTGDAPPKPAFLMHQLGGLEGKFPRLDGQVFAAKVKAMLAAPDKTNVPQ